MITIRHFFHMLAVCAVLGLLATGMTGCQDSKKAALEHPKFTTPPQQPPGPPIGQSAPISGGQTSFGPGGQPGNTKF